MSNIILVGKPNSGKSSLFNALTAGDQKVANYSGVTVAKKTAEFFNGSTIADLPGFESLWDDHKEAQIVREEVFSLDKTRGCNFICGARSCHF